MNSRIAVLSMLFIAAGFNEAQASAAVDDAQVLNRPVATVPAATAQNADGKDLTVPAVEYRSTTNAIAPTVQSTNGRNANAGVRSSSYSSKWFIGGAAQLSSFKAKFNKAHNLHNSATGHNSSRLNFDDELQGSLNVGFNYYFPIGTKNALFIAPEVVYNFVSLESDKTVSLSNGNSTNFRLELEPTWEAKLSLGIEFHQKFSIAVGVGAQLVQYDYNYSGLASSNHGRHNGNGQDEIAIGTSIALGYNLGKHLMLKTGVSYYNFDFNLKNQDIVVPGTSIIQNQIKAEMLTTKLGIEWAF